MNPYFIIRNLFVALFLCGGLLSQAQPDDNVNESQTEIFLQFGMSNTAMRDRAISKFAYYGNGAMLRLGVAHRNDGLQYGLSFGFQVPTLVTEMRKGLKYNEFTKDTVNKISGDEVDTRMVDVGGNLLFKQNKKSESDFSLWLGARFDFISISKKFLILDHQQLSSESYITLSPMAQLEYQPHYRHRFTYSLDASLFGYASKELQYNLKPGYYETDRYISLYKTSGGESFKNLLQVNSTLGYRFVLFKNMAIGAQYIFIYNRYSEPLEVRMVRQNAVIYLAINF